MILLYNQLDLGLIAHLLVLNSLICNRISTDVFYATYFYGKPVALEKLIVDERGEAKS